MATDTVPSGAQPLTGVRVIELGSMYAAPTAGRMLRDFGADVVKVEDPTAGDFARQWQPSHNGTAMSWGGSGGTFSSRISTRGARLVPMRTPSA